MEKKYRVKAFKPTIKGCAALDRGWDDERCKQYENFLNQHSRGGWRLVKSDYRDVIMAGCRGKKGAALVCVFEKDFPSPGTTG